ncbi:MAG: DUF2851 family protein [Bacteroidetes bacterium]|nr:DUF2851 family protein [Bacteroidota bacterium]MCL5268058.1 DUF2851 family protein [Bacteroidota bacterium]
MPSLQAVHPEDLSEFQLKELFKNRMFNSSLKSVSGMEVEIIRTGEPNYDAGPDFRRAVIRINGTLMRGDVELHRLNSDWYSHKHHTDRNYNSVILHVVGEYNEVRDCLTCSGRKIENLELPRFLTDEAISFLARLDSEERMIRIRCAGQTDGIPRQDKIEYLNLLGEKRFAHKVNKFEDRLKDIVDENRPVVFEARQKYFRDFSELQIVHGTYDKSELQEESYWDQLLYEGMLEGLGYSKNTTPFRKLARSVALSFLKEHSNGDRNIIEAILFGASGLLPQDLSGFDEESRTYCEGLAQIWQGLKKKYKREYMDRSEWLFFKLRPQNFPTIRIAGASHLLSNLMSGYHAMELTGWAATKGESELLVSWRRFLTVPSQDFWSRHFVFGTPATADVRMLIGSSRAEEIIINILLPMVYLRGRIFDNPILQERGMKIYVNHRPTADNNITLMMKDALFGGDNVFNTVQAQQGALHIYRTLCSEKRCSRCKIGKAVYGGRKSAA